MLAVVLIGGTILLLFAMILAWVTYTVAVIRKDMAYIGELNKIVDHVNTLAYEIHQAHERTSTRVNRAETTAQGANSDNVELHSRLDSLNSKITDYETAISEANNRIDDVNNSVIVNTEEIQNNLSTIQAHDDQFGEMATLVASTVTDDSLESRIEAAMANMDSNLANFASKTDVENSVAELGDNMMNGIATNALELNDVDGTGSASLRYDGSDNSVNLVIGSGDPSVKIQDGGIVMNGGILKVDPTSKELQYCQSMGVCSPVNLGN
ncbi:hypothetical protein TetV_163 [Tetraselmis virus 1]|uniref:Uncharacterized protein n=1 Tax=Tetraselmis virus 1 TaxID=2060617 RepID=A0A2P0VMW9_9VIRU|nr:hypothetical protein QJ968_gp163 [Tetraselmis virus 1]AUF82255.1 hypothetical protein TetV_163 [Tetraselmis virus 1]